MPLLGSLQMFDNYRDEILRLRLNGRDIWFAPHIAQCALFLGFQLPNFFAKQVDVRQITHGKHSNGLPLP